MSRRVVGLTISIGGAVLVFVAAAADLVGISSGGSADQFGKNQVVGTAVGAAVILVGALIAFLPMRAAVAGTAWRVSDPGVRLAAAPGAADEGDLLASGTPVTAQDRQGDWVRVVTADGRTGWAPRSSLF